VALERGAPAFVVDSLGTGALNYDQMHWNVKATRDPMIEARVWKLVIFQIGTNVFGLHKDWIKEAFDTVKAACARNGGATILVMTPPDLMKNWEDPHSDVRIVWVSKELKQLAAENGLAFWDFREAMGGDAAIKKFIKNGLAAGDKIHMRKEGAELMADRFLCAVHKDFKAYLAEHPTAGCGTGNPPK